jgi:hypothetical protein
MTHEVKPMRRFLTTPLALLAGLAVLLTACSGESPTAPTPPGGGGGGGNCNVTITLASTSSSPFAGSAVFVRATVRRDGAPVPDGTSVVFTTDLGFFLETGQPTVSKTTVSGVAEVTLASLSVGAAHVKASVDCATAQLLPAVQFQQTPGNNPFISSIFPTSGSCAGGETVTINGGLFGADASLVRVTFGGKPATIVSVSNTQIVVKTPSEDRPANAPPDQRDAVDVVVTLNAGTAGSFNINLPKGFSYFCVQNRIFISSVVPNSGLPAGGETVVINGGHFGTNIATTRVTFCGVSATIVSQNDGAITVLTPRHQLTNPSVSETCDVGVTIDLGLVSQQDAIARNAFTYRGAGPAECQTNAGTFISSLSPNTGGGEGATPVTILGAGFTSSVANTRVEFGGVPGTVTAVTPTSITVLTPQHTIANPSVPEPVSVRVIVDSGGSNQVCATLANGFVYTQVGLEPTIFSTSPRTGPNDASTRVTIFGNNFQFPMQVFVSTGACRIEAQVVSISYSEVVFLTPIALNGNSCLANQTVDVTVINPYTGKTATCPECFRYYPCPTFSNVVPSTVPYNQTSTVVINGQNFEEPVEATLNVAGQTIHLNVTAVASSGVTVQLPPIDAIQTGGCADVPATISITHTSACPALTVPITYQVNRITLTSASPTQLNQNGSTFGSGQDAAPATITVSGTNFQDPSTVVLVGPTGTLAYTQVNNPVVANGGSLTFPAPAIRSTDFNTQACSLGGDVIGTKLVPTSFSIKVTNSRTGCTATLPNILVYTPNDTTCRAAAAIATTTLPNATLCSAYGPVTLQGIGGTGPYTWTASGLPSGLTLDPATGVISGTPTLAAAGPGTANSVASVTVTLTDSSTPAQTSTRNYSLQVTDPGAPFTITGQTTQNIPAAGGNTSALTAGPATFGPITWSIDKIEPSVPGITLNSTTGSSTTLNVLGSVPGGTYTVTVRATDNSCGANHHTATFPLTIIKTAGTLAISSGTPASGTLCTPYTFTFTASGGTLPYLFSASPLPAGLTINSSTGVLSGTPVLPASGIGGDTTTNVTVTVTDSSAAPQSTSATYNLTITDPNGPFSINGPVTATIPGGGGSTASFAAVPNPTPSGFTPINWSIDSITPSVPGITLSASTGQSTQIQVAGSVPPGNYNVVLRATDTACGSFKHTATTTVAITNTGAPVISSPNTLTLPAATLCTLYTTSLGVTGGTAPYTWSIDGGSPNQLPPGLSLNPLGQTVQITGIPYLPTSGPGGNQTYTITFKVTDSSPIPQSGTRTYTLGVQDPDGPFVITGPGSQTFTSTSASDGGTLNALVNQNNSGNLTAPTWTPIYWEIVSAGGLNGFTIVGSSGGNPTSGLTAHLAYDGTANTPGQYNVTVRAIDSPPCVNLNPGVRHTADYNILVTINQ